MSKTDQYFLSTGAHKAAEDGRCAMEWVAYLAGEPHSDTPVCVSPVLTRFCIALNDRLPAAERQKLRPYLARTIGTRDDGRDQERLDLCREWLMKTSLPRVLDRIGMTARAERLRTLPAALAPALLEREMQEARAEALKVRDAARERLRQNARARFPAYVAAAYVAASGSARTTPPGSTTAKPRSRSTASSSCAATTPTGGAGGHSTPRRARVTSRSPSSEPVRNSGRPSMGCAVRNSATRRTGRLRRTQTTDCVQTRRPTMAELFDAIARYAQAGDAYDGLVAGARDAIGHARLLEAARVLAARAQDVTRALGAAIAHG